MQTLWQDIRYGIRVLRKSPGFTVLAVLTLALGIGANSTIFSWLNATLLNPLPGVANPQQIVVVARGKPGHVQASFSYADFMDLRERNRTLSGLTASAIYPISLTEQEKPERLWATMVSANYFDDLGVRPIHGRGFLPAEDHAPGGAAFVVISYHLWQRRFDGNPAAVGRTISLNNHRYTIVGIAPSEFQGSYTGLRADLWVPLMMAKQIIASNDLLEQRGDSWLVVLGRLKPGINREQAQSELNLLMQQIVRQYPDEHAGLKQISLFPLWKAPYGATVYLGGVLLMLMGIAGVVLLLTCANVANLLLVRGVSRRRELAIRLALGANRVRLIRQMLTESLMLALMGGGIAILITLWSSKTFMNMAPPSDLPIWISVNVDRRVFLVSLAASMFTGILFGVLPAFRASSVSPISVLKDESGSAAGGVRKARLSGGLAVAQVSLSLLMLISAVLLIRSFRNAQGFNPGFNPKGVLLESYDLFPTGDTSPQGIEFDHQALEKIRTLPGVQSASLANWIPLGFSNSSDAIKPEGYVPGPHEVMEAGVAVVSPDYFRTMEIPLVNGRDFSVEDNAKSQNVVVVNQALVDRYWSGRDAIGKRVQVGKNFYSVVGVASTSRYYSLNEPPEPFIYYPLDQNYTSNITLHVRVTGGPANMALAVQNAIHEMNAGLPVFDITTLDSRIQVSSGILRIAGSTVGIFGLLALILAAVGIYGVVAYSTKQRTREIGIRVALGAQRRDVFRLVIGQGVRLTLIGVAIGLIAAYFFSRILSSLLFGVSASDPLTFGAGAIFLGAVALGACYIPAWRAMRVDPMVALRYE
jgi:predicted permease